MVWYAQMLRLLLPLLPHNYHIYEVVGIYILFHFLQLHVVVLGHN